MKNWLKRFALAAASCAALGASGVSNAAEQVPLDQAPDYTDNLASLQHGAQLFVNYCLNCHSASLMRYSKLEEIGIPQKEIEANLLFTGDKVGDTMTAALRPDDAKAWFGAVPPDLSLVARSRGRDWLYTYLRTFYRDTSRPTGWNNLIYENVGMPHALWQLQGQRIANFRDEKDEAGETVHRFIGFQQVMPGTMSAVDYDSAVADLVSYMTWMAEPVQKERKRLGVWVLLFLGALSFLTWRLNAAYWKDIH
jgi:ubiquinol-cytochrome c reductase cytochrome c1 subunit